MTQGTFNSFFRRRLSYYLPGYSRPPTMSLVSPPERQVHFADPTDVKNNGDSTLDSDSPVKGIKSSRLIATVEKDEPVVTRKELWSYYRASLLCTSLSVLNQT